MGYLSLVVLLPLAALIWSSRGRRPRLLLAPGDPAGGALGLEADARRWLPSAPWSTPSRARRSPGCSCATLSRARARQRASSTCRSRCPTIVAGLTLLALYGPGGPVRRRRRLHALGAAARAAVRDAAVRRAGGAAGPARARHARWRRRPLRSAPARFTIFRRIVLPNLLPAILSGVALAFARAVGEFGAVVLISGNIPVQDRGLVRLHLRPAGERKRAVQPPSRSCCS